MPQQISYPEFSAGCRLPARRREECISVECCCHRWLPGSNTDTLTALISLHPAARLPWILEHQQLPHPLQISLHPHPPISCVEVCDYLCQIALSPSVDLYRQVTLLQKNSCVARFCPTLVIVLSISMQLKFGLGSSCWHIASIMCIGTSIGIDFPLCLEGVLVVGLLWNCWNNLCRLYQLITNILGPRLCHWVLLVHCIYLVFAINISWQENMLFVKK